MSFRLKRNKLTPDRSPINPDGEDCSLVTVSVTDAKGRVVPTANNLVHFTISRAGKIIGVGNGNPTCHEPDVYFSNPKVRMVPLNDNWRMTKVSGTKDRPETAVDFNGSGWKPANVRSDSGPLQANEAAVFRTQFELTNGDSPVEKAILRFEMIDDEGWIYVNGQFVGVSLHWNESPSFEIGKFLHPGNNVIAVVVKNNDGPGGVNKGVELILKHKPALVPWQRSVFNGLAQVVVQSMRKPGEIKLAATADGLSPASILIATKPESRTN